MGKDHLPWAGRGEWQEGVHTVAGPGSAGSSGQPGPAVAAMLSITRLPAVDVCRPHLIHEQCELLRKTAKREPTEHHSNPGRYVIQPRDAASTGPDRELSRGASLLDPQCLYFYHLNLLPPQPPLISANSTGPKCASVHPAFSLSTSSSSDALSLPPPKLSQTHLPLLPAGPRHHYLSVTSTWSPSFLCSCPKESPFCTP